MKNFNRAQESGRSMIEMLGVLAIVGVLSIGGISGYSKAMAKYKVNQGLDQVANLIINIRSTFVNQTDFTDATTANIIKLGIVTQDMIDPDDGTAMINPFGGSITVAPGADVSTFTISYAGLDSSACQSIALADWGAQVSSGLVQMKINDAAFTWGGKDGAGLPLTIGNVAKNCTKDAAAGYNTIEWTYR